MKKIIFFFTFFFLLAGATIYSQSTSHSCQHAKGHSNALFTEFKNQSVNSRSDTFDILNYAVTMDFTNWGGKTIDAHCTIRFTPKINGIDYLNLDLLELTVDSVVNPSGLLNFSHNDTLIHIDLPAPINISDTVELTVYYHGSAPTDPSGFGGLHWNSNYAFNLGVGFLADPHNFGRAWHPCFDNFVERATYDFHIISNSGRKAQCNGMLTGETLLAGGAVRRDWRMDQPIPSYLACVAVANYATVNQVHNGLSGDIPITLTALAADTTDLKNSFINLGGAINAFEYWFGEHQWNKIGYVLTSAGAMEHPTAIFYPDFIANGSVDFEDVMAHELGHHWWGNLITCETAEDMWINEGMSEYASHLFFEVVYGRDDYIKRVVDNHLEVLQYAHIEEGGYRAISGLPHDLTYGTHVYNKGAAMGHNLRTYLGDDLFRSGMQSLMNNFKFSSINSAEMRDHLTSVTGIDLTSFFNDWVFNPGYSDFDIDSFSVLANGPDFDLNLQVSQKLRGAPAMHTNVPLTATFYNEDWSSLDMDFMVSGASGQAAFTLPFEPVMTVLNQNNALNLARSGEVLELRSTGFYPSIKAKIQVIVGAVSDSALLKVIHHWTGPDPIQNNPLNYRISSSRYWTIDGNPGDDFAASARLFYDGREITGGGNGYLDNDLLSITEDSLILLYRPDASEDWTVFPHYTKNTLGGSTNAYGLIIVDSLRMGQYAFANGILLTDLDIPERPSEPFCKVYPNPGQDYFNVETAFGPDSGYKLQLFNILGQRVMGPVTISSNLQTIDVSPFPSGVYLLALQDVEGHFIVIRKLELAR